MSMTPPKSRQTFESKSFWYLHPKIDMRIPIKHFMCKITAFFTKFDLNVLQNKESGNKELQIPKCICYAGSIN